MALVHWLIHFGTVMSFTGLFHPGKVRFWSWSESFCKETFHFGGCGGGVFHVVPRLLALFGFEQPPESGRASAGSIIALWVVVTICGVIDALFQQWHGEVSKVLKPKWKEIVNILLTWYWQITASTIFVLVGLICNDLIGNRLLLFF